MEIILLVTGYGLYFIGRREGARDARIDFTHTVWMADATDEQKQRFITGKSPPSPPD